MLCQTRSNTAVQRSWWILHNLTPRSPHTQLLTHGVGNIVRRPLDSPSWRQCSTSDGARQRCMPKRTVKTIFPPVGNALLRSRMEISKGRVIIVSSGQRRGGEVGRFVTLGTCRIAITQYVLRNYSRFTMFYVDFWYVNVNHMVIAIQGL